MGFAVISDVSGDKYGVTLAYSAKQDWDFYSRTASLDPMAVSCLSGIFNVM